MPLQNRWVHYANLSVYFSFLRTLLRNSRNRTVSEFLPMLTSLQQHFFLIRNSASHKALVTSTLKPERLAYTGVPWIIIMFVQHLNSGWYRIREKTAAWFSVWLDWLRIASKNVQSIRNNSSLISFRYQHQTETQVRVSSVIGCRPSNTATWLSLERNLPKKNN